MPIFLNDSDADFGGKFAELLGAKREVSADIGGAVADIISDVRQRGDAAVTSYTAKFDRLELTPDQLRLAPDEIEDAIAKVSPQEYDALQLAAQRIEAYHQRQRPEDVSWVEPSGAELGWRWRPVEAAGLYVPGGLASYPSSVLMNAIPARVAGVERLVMAVPTPDGIINPLVILAAKISGVNEIYRIGGAQAIAALAYGTQTIEKVDKITGPGNAYVAAAKAQVFGQVGIDMIAGPSEIVVIADETADPRWVALDLLSQAEHDASAQSILISTDRAFSDAVSKNMTEIIPTLSRAEIARASWNDYGAIITVPDLERAAQLSDQLAPEHLELCVADPQTLSERITHAGAVFMGAWTPEAIGDYVGGPNHVLPTARSARYASGLSVIDFLKRTTLSRMTPQALKEIGPAAVQLAKSESLEAHGLSVSARLDRLNISNDDA